MPLWATITLVVTVAGTFWRGVPLDRLYEAFQPSVVSLSIMIAAIFVRLNRGMPTLDWKSLEAVERTRLTTKIVDLTREYAVIVGLYALVLLILIGLTVVGKDYTIANWPSERQSIVSGGLGGLAALCICRMCYVVWRDYDIVKLQKKLIDDAGFRDKHDADLKSANEKVADIKTASMRRFGAAEIKPWN